MAAGDSQESVTEWILQLRETGDEAAAQHLWQRYMTRLVDLARRKLGASSKKLADEEDVAIIAFEHFCRGARDGRFPKLDDRDDLWQVLIMLTDRRAIDQKRKRKLTTGESSGVDIGQVASREPTPELASEMCDHLTMLMQSLGTHQLQRLVMLKMAAHTNEEIATELKCSVRTVERKLGMIRKCWKHVFENRTSETSES